MSLGSDLSAVVKVLLGPFIQLGLRLIPVRDPWKRIPQRVPLSLYGTGSLRDFGWYLEGESRVPVANIDEIQDWLLGCEYVDDRELFHEHDFWQHPRTFEHLRRGDCEDHALWAWRKLVELGIDAELVSGRHLSSPGQDEAGSGHGGHVWVVFTRETETIVFETVAKTKEGMLRPLTEVRTQYRPEVGVDRVRRRFAYGGYLLTLRERRSRGKALRAAALSIVLAAFIGCAREKPGIADTSRLSDSPGGAVAPQPPQPAPFKFDSGTIVVQRACPFECCTYRDWELLTGAPLRAGPGRSADSLAFLAAGTPVKADSGLVVMNPPGLVVITGTPPKLLMAGDVPFKRGDTLVILNHIGEGMRRVRWKDREMEIDEYWRTPGQGARVIRPAVQHWWTHVTTDLHRGWILMDSVRVKGADRCA